MLYSNDNPLNYDDECNLVANLTMRFLDGLITPEEFGLLNQFVGRNPDHAKTFVSLAAQGRLLAEATSSVQYKDDANHSPTPEMENEAVGDPLMLLITRAAQETPEDLSSLHLDAIDHETEALLREVMQQQDHAHQRHELEQAQRSIQQANAQTEALERTEYRAMLAGRSEPVKPIKHYVIPKPVFYGAIAAVVALTAMLFWPNQSPPPEVVEVKPTAPQWVQVATLVEQVDAKWLAPGNSDPAPGDALLNQKMYLVSGLAKIRFNNEAEVILEAPCSIEPIAGDEIKITYGKLVGRCRTAESKGFVVQTPSARIVDLGTEFGVSVDQDGVSDAHVFEGEIKLAVATSDQPVYLFQGQSRQVNAAGTGISPIETAESAFVRDEEFEANARAAESPYHRWLAHSYKLRRDPNLVAYYPFDAANAAQSPDLLLNRAVRTGSQLHGRLGRPQNPSSKPKWAIGRWGQKPALRFDQDQRQHVRVPDSSHFKGLNAITLCVWVKVDDPSNLSHLLSKRETLSASEINDTFNLVWVGRAHGDHVPGSLFFSAGEYLGEKFEFSTGQILQGRNDWVHIGVTFNGRETVFYLNGQPVAQQNRRKQILDTSSEVIIGGAIDRFIDEFMNGLMDEAAIFDKALSEQDIRVMYEAGKL